MLAKTAGIVSVVLGLCLLAKESYYSPRHRMTIDFGEYHWLIGLFFIAGGLALLFVRSRAGKGSR